MFLLLLLGCVDPSKPRTPQQKDLDERAFSLLSTPVDDQISDFANQDVGDIIDEEIDREPVIGESFYKRISISVNEKMRMREVLTQMASLAGVNIFIAHDIEGSISFTAKDRPFLDILKDICSSMNLKYAISGNSVKVEFDSPMLKFYRIPALNIQRDTQSSMTTSTDIFSGNVFSSTTGANDDISKLANSSSNNGSSSAVSGSTKNNFWSELEDALKIIVGNSDEGYVSIHRQGGLVTAYTTQSKHDEIQKYIKLLKELSETQVLIEAKIIEVNLKDEYRSGINWNILRSGGAKFNKTFSKTENLFYAGVERNNLNIVAGFIERFGAVKTLSSPRITILNNHSAILKVAKNEVVYLPEFQKQYNGRNSDNITDMLSTNMRTIPIGLIMTVQPSIDTKNNTVLLTLRPTISKISGYNEVPFLFNSYMRQAGASQIQATPQIQKVPVVDVREMDSVVKLNSGQIVVMGGLMQEKSHNKREGLPGFQDTPVDFISGERNRETEVTELVIFLRATILRKNRRVHHKADEKVYNTFSSDPRKLKFSK
jgi:general secretion pathway protein D